MNNLINSIINPINLIFIAFMIIFFIWEIKSKKDLKSIIVSTGVLGTFVGIFVGLLNFDTHNLKISIENILEGLKTAFLTSIVGMGLAIILSIIERYQNRYDTDYKEFQVLNEIKEQLSKFLFDKNSNKIIEELERLRLVNNDIKDEIKNINTMSHLHNEEIKKILTSNFETLNYSLALAIEHLSKGATEEIIKALKKVIEDFNQELQTQFGENFVKLNEAVLNLLQWQENYKSYIESTEKVLNISLTAIKNSEASLKAIENSQKNINELYKNLEEIIKISKLEIDELNRHLQTYKELSDKAKEYLENLDKVNSQFENLVNVISNSVNIQQEAIKMLVKITSEEIKKYIQQNQYESEKFINEINILFKNLTNNINNDVMKQQEIIKEFIKTSTNQLINSFEKPKEELNLIIEHFKQIEQQIPRALEVSLENLNNGLASLTRKFREDYETILNNYKKNIRS